MSNIHPDTGIRFGIIKVDSIHPDVLETLLYRVGKDLSHAEALKDYLAEEERKYEAAQEEKRIARAEIDGGTLSEEDDLPFDAEAATDEFNNSFQCDEPIVEGEHEGVKYRTTWLGGAQLLWIFESPVLTKCRLCSPCVPGAGDLNSVGDELAYGVPVEWLDEQFIIEQINKADYGLMVLNRKYHYCYGGFQQISKAEWSTSNEAAEGCYRTNLQADAPCQDEGCDHHGTDHVCNPVCGKDAP